MRDLTQDGRRQPHAHDLVFTLYGEYLLHRTSAVWVGSLIVLLGGLGVSPAGVRTALSRMRRRGWLKASRRGRRSYYGLTAKGRKLLEAGEHRIYRPPRHQAWDGCWSLVTYSVPEDHRSMRDRLRVRLSWLGLGQVGNGVWLSAHDVSDEVKEVVEGLGGEAHVEIFRGEHLGFSDARTLVSASWDLDSVNREYEAFLDRHEDDYRSCRRRGEGGGLSPEECFVRRFGLTHEYRRFPFMDPYLPEPLLPEGWLGDRAADLFDAYHELLSPLAEEYVETVCEFLKAPGRAEESRPAEPAAGSAPRGARAARAGRAALVREA